MPAHEHSDQTTNTPLHHGCERIYIHKTHIEHVPLRINRMLQRNNHIYCATQEHSIMPRSHVYSTTADYSTIGALARLQSILPREHKKRRFSTQPEPRTQQHSLHHYSQTWLHAQGTANTPRCARNAQHTIGFIGLQQAKVKKLHAEPSKSFEHAFSRANFAARG